MYNLLISLGVAALLFGLVTAWLGPVAAVIPALFVLVVAYLLISYRIGQIVQVELAPLAPMLQERKIAEAVAKLEAVKARWSKWQFLLAGQIDAQIGMIDYLQLKFDAALPRLEAGRWRNWMALVAIGAIWWRKGDKEKAFATLKEATDAGPKESTAWMVRAVLLAKADRTEDALKVLDEGLKTLEKNPTLTDLRATIANKKKIDTAALGQAWIQFFPEELQHQMQMQAMMRGRKDGQLGVVPGMQGPGGPNLEPPKLNRKMRRQK
jgi:predicted Zn-dependent protease